MNARLQTGSPAPNHFLQTVKGHGLSIPDPEGLIHLQLRRFAGCPVCNLHMHELRRRHTEIRRAGVREIVVFHSSTQELLPFTEDLPFDVISDARKSLYASFGAESGVRSMLNPRGWPAILRGITASILRVWSGKEPMPSINPEGGRFGLPAEFLIDRNGVIAALKYGEHVDDQWSVDEMLRIASKHRSQTTPAGDDG